MERRDRLRQLRNERSLTQKEVAKKIGVTEGTLNRYETGKIKTIPTKSLKALAKLYGCSEYYLLGAEEYSDKERRMMKRYRQTKECFKEIVDKLLNMDETKEEREETDGALDHNSVRIWFDSGDIYTVADDHIKD